MHVEAFEPFVLGRIPIGGNEPLTAGIKKHQRSGRSARSVEGRDRANGCNIVRFPHAYDAAVVTGGDPESIGRNRNHLEISADMYANPFNAGAVVNRLDCVILGATEVDVDFNVNVNTESTGYLLHNTGGHSDTAAGAKLAIIVAPSIRGRLPIVRDEVTTVTTPGETVDVIVTERGIAVNDKHEDLKKELIRLNVPVKDIRQLQREICQVTGTPRPLEFEDEIVALIEYRDGSVIDAVRRVKE